MAGVEGNRVAAAPPVFDAHLHIVDPRFALQGSYRPPWFTVDDYLRRVRPLGVAGGAVVSGSFQGFDQTYLRDALARLGPRFVGVTQLPADVPDAEVLALDAAGVRAVRFNLVRGGSAGVLDLERLGRRVADLAGWHVELYVDATELPAVRLARVVVDHLGLSQAGLPALLRAVARGWRVKASGFSRGDLDVGAALRAVADVDPGALLFGTDLPSTRAPRPFADADLELVREAGGSRAVWENAVALYRPATVAA
jgi:predicted TIM-barrel fold metal-dependent hydrolase